MYAVVLAIVPLIHLVYRLCAIRSLSLDYLTCWVWLHPQRLIYIAVPLLLDGLCSQRVSTAPAIVHGHHCWCSSCYIYRRIAADIVPSNWHCDISFYFPNHNARLTKISLIDYFQRWTEQKYRRIQKAVCLLGIRARVWVDDGSVMDDRGIGEVVMQSRKSPIANKFHTTKQLTYKSSTSFQHARKPASTAGSRVLGEVMV